MPTIRLQPSQLARALRGDAQRVRMAMKSAALGAARRFVAYLKNEIDRRGITDLGIFKASWKAVRNPDGGASISSDAPQAGVIELGARPHPVSQEGRDAIAAWAQRKLGLSPAEAMRAAFLIARKISREGQKPTYLVRDSLPHARTFYGEEIVRVLNSRATS